MIKKATIFGLLYIVFVLLLSGCVAPANKSNNNVIIPSDQKVALNDLLQKGKKLYAQKKYEKANQCFALAVKHYQASADAHAWYGISLGELASAAKSAKANEYGFNSVMEFSKALTIDPDHLMAHFGCGKAFLLAPLPYKDVKKAIEEFKIVLKKQPANVEAKYFLALAYIDRGEKNSARKIFAEIKKDAPGHPLIGKIDQIKL